MTYTREKLQVDNNQGEMSEIVTSSYPTAIWSLLSSWVAAEVGKTHKTFYLFLVTYLCWFSMIFWVLPILQSNRVKSQLTVFQKRGGKAREGE